MYGELELILFDKQFGECWRYATQDILFGGQGLSLDENGIRFEDFEGNYHEVDWHGNQRKYVEYGPKTVTVNMKTIQTPEQFQKVLAQMVPGMPEIYGMNWDAFWDVITGMTTLPDYLILDGWHMYKKVQEADAETFEKIMRDYNMLEGYRHCECVYKHYSRNETVWYKSVKAARQLMPDAPLELPYEGAKEMLLVEELDDREFVRELLNAMFEELPTPRKKKQQE